MTIPPHPQSARSRTSRPSQIVSRTRSKLGKYAIPDAASILPGKMKTVKIDGRDVLLIRVRFFFVLSTPLARAFAHPLTSPLLPARFRSVQTSKGQLRATGAKCP